jgi:hypothetical protein
VQVFTPEGEAVGQIPVTGWPKGGSEPHLTVDGKGRLLATIPTQNRIVLLDPVRGEIASFDGTGDPKGPLALPTGIDARGDVVLVSDTNNHRIRKFVDLFPE